MQNVVQKIRHVNLHINMFNVCPSAVWWSTNLTVSRHTVKHNCTFTLSWCLFFLFMEHMRILAAKLSSVTMFIWARYLWNDSRTWKHIWSRRHHIGKECYHNKATTKKVWTVGRLSSIHVQYWIDTSTIKVEQNSLTQTYSTAHRIHHVHWCHFPLSPPHTTDIFYKPNKCSWLIKHTFPSIRQY